MYVLPAIDLIEGKCVRLLQGQYHRQITYHDDPAAQAREFADVGAQWLHVVDLEGAKIGKPVNTEAVKAIVAVSKLKVELGGGIRDEDSIKQMLDLGLERVIIGTKAVSDFVWFCDMTRKFPAKLVLGLDAKGSKVAVHGWTEDTHQNMLEFADKAAELPIAAIPPESRRTAGAPTRQQPRPHAPHLRTRSQYGPLGCAHRSALGGTRAP